MTGLDPEVNVEFIVGRDLLTRASAADRETVARFLLALLASGGVVSLAQTVPGLGQRLSPLAAGLLARLAKKVAAAEESAYADASSDLAGWRPEDLAAAFRQAGGRDVTVEVQQFTDPRRVSERELDAWLAPASSYGRALGAGLSPEELGHLKEALRRQLLGRETPWTRTVAFVIARK